MNRYCYHCGAQIESTVEHCPLCSARQSKPGDPFIGFLIYHAMNFFGSTLGFITLVILIWLIVAWLS